MPRNPIQDLELGKVMMDRKSNLRTPQPAINNAPAAYNNMMGRIFEQWRDLNRGYSNPHLARDAYRNLEGRVKGYEGRPPANGRGRRRKTTRRIGRGRKRAAPKRRKPVRRGTGRPWRRAYRRRR